MNETSPLKMLLMGDLSILKKDDPSLIHDFIQQFQMVSGTQSSASEMMFIRACHFDSVNVVNAMLSENLIISVGIHDFTCFKAALKNDSGRLLIRLLEHAEKEKPTLETWAKEAATQGSVFCLKVTIEKMKEEGRKDNLLKILDECSVSLVKNAMKKPAEKILDGLILLQEYGATLSGTSQNLLANAVLAHQHSNMVLVVDYLLDKGVQDTSLIAARTALAQLVRNAPKSYGKNTDLIGNDHIAHIKEMKERIEKACQGKLPERGRAGHPLVSLA